MSTRLDPLRLTIDEIERHNLLTCRSGDTEYDRAQSGRSSSCDPDNARDHDGPPLIDEAYERLHLRGTDRCACGGYAMLTIGHETGRGMIREDSPIVRCAWCASCGHRVTLPDDRQVSELISEWNASAKRRALLMAEIRRERKGKYDL